MCTGEVGEGPVVESSVELAVHKAAGRVEVFPGPVVATGARGAQETDKTRREVRAGGAQETDKTRREVRAGGAREVEEIADNFTEGDESTIEESSLIRFEESNIELFGEAAHDNTAGEGVAVRDKTAGESEAIRDKIAGGEAAHDNTAGERVREFTVDPFVGLAVLEAVDRVDEEADEDTIDKIARIEAVLDKIAGDEAINDNTIDPFVELVVLEAADRVDEEADKNIVEEIVSNSSTEAILVAEERVDEFSVDPSIEAIQAAERIDKEAEGPKFESKLQ